MYELTKPKFSLLQLLCKAADLPLRPLYVPLQLAIHSGMGERAAGLSFGVGVLVMAAWAAVANSSALGFAAAVIVGWAVIRRGRCVRARLGGGPLVHSRSIGTPLLARVMPRVPVGTVLWVQPYVTMAVAVVVSELLSDDLGGYLTCASVALLAATALRKLADYHRTLDLLDAEVERLDAEAKRFGPDGFAPLFANSVRGFPLDAASLLPVTAVLDR